MHGTKKDVQRGGIVDLVLLFVPFFPLLSLVAELNDTPLLSRVIQDWPARTLFALYLVYRIPNLFDV